VYGREIDGRTLTLFPSGWTYRQTFVLYDKETGTLWYPDGEDLLGIQGPLVDRRLPGLRTEDTGWSDWVRRHPASRVLE
jgi:Protein of unknown function (DUF3179)